MNPWERSPLDQIQPEIEALVARLQEASDREHLEKCWILEKITWRQRRKFFAIDIGGSGAFLVDAAGEIYNIKGYGRPDYNKKKKADLGNIRKVCSAAALLEKRYNYLR